MFLKMLFFLVLFLNSCAINQNKTVFKEIKTSKFTIASWQKITDKTSPIIFYIEGDGNSFDIHGQPTKNPTPISRIVRNLSFEDTSPNVVYLARPCQFVNDIQCEEKYWTTARFSEEVVNSIYEVIKSVAGNRPIILIGYSGGAQIAGLVAVINDDLNVEKIITIAGNLDHNEWTRQKKLTPLKDSLDLKDYYDKFILIPQHHYIGEKDKIIYPKITKNFIANDELITVVSGANHWNIKFRRP